MSNKTNNSYLVSQINLITTYIYAYVGLVIFIMGTIGNLSNIFVFIRLRSLSSLPSSWFLIASFIGSQCVLSTGVISRTILGFSGVDPLVSSIIWCKIRYVVGPLAGCITLHCIALGSVDRYLITNRRVALRRWITVKRAHYIIGFVVLLWFVTNLPNAIYYTPPLCSITNPTFALFSRLFSLIVYSIVPVFFLFLFCILTWINLQNVASRLIRLTKINHQVNKMMIAQIIVVLFATMPNIIVQIYSLITMKTTKSPLRLSVEGFIIVVLSMIAFIPYAGTFYVYLIVSRSYRHNVKTVIFQCQNRTNRVSSR